MNKKIIWIALVIILIILIVRGIVTTNRQASTGEPIKIGVMYMLSGDGAAWGENAKKGTDMAVEEYNAVNPDKPVVTIYGDTRTSAKEAVTVFNKLVSLDKVQFILGPLFQHELMAVDPLIQQKGIPVMAPGYFSRESRTNLKNPLLMWLDAMIETDRIASYVLNQGIKNISVMSTTDPWESAVGKQFNKRMTEAGVKVLAHEFVQTDAIDDRVSVAKLLANKPEAIFISTYLQYVNTLKALGEQRYKGKIYSIEIDEYLAGETKNFVSEVLVIGPENYASGFGAKFESKYGVKPGMPAGHAYDATRLLLEIISKNSDPKEVLNAFKTIKSYRGVSGSVEFTEDGKTLFPTALFSIKDGGITRVTELK